ncbi:MAG: endopeptidase La [Kiritimatiellae bacterium]|nr:endopeptidase La [Kiritimatiellia bacterium]MDD5522421.1 endopeptidase La [Kiritimatiellia bacterium]
MDKDKNKPQEPQQVEVLKKGDTSQEKRLILVRDVFPRTLPIVPLYNRPVFPKMTVPMIIDDEKTKKLLIDTTKSQSKFVGMVLNKERPEGQDQDQKPEMHSVGVIAEILQIAQLAPEAPIQVLIGAMERFSIQGIIHEEPYILAKVDYIMETEMAGNEELKAYSLSVIKSIKELIQLNPLHKEELSLFMSRSSLTEPGRLADFAAALTTASGKELQEILETISIRARLKKVLLLLKKEIDISKIQVQISKQIDEKISKQQREFFLREQLRAIKKELGLEKEGKEAEVERFEKRLKELKLTDEASERIHEEMEKLRLIEPASPEFNVTRNYLDWLTVLPWGVFTKDSYDIKKAFRILNRDHYGLEDVKERILEFLSVGIMKGNIAGSILCFVGPPGVGKTSIGQSIAKSIGRNFYRFSVGGIRDEAEIKGHRRTYIGALPGKFLQAIKTCKSANPVIMLDEIDKIGASYQGDPASALLEVLDPEQNRDFLDHYLDVRFDLSNVFFICTANQLDTIPRPLLDRMEVIKLSGYILQEKLEIARKFLIPKQLKAHGVEKKQITITNDALKEIIDGYAREAGVRGLENHIKKIIRKSVKKMIEKKGRKFTIGAKEVDSLLGKRIFTDDNYYKKPQVGVVMGLAWTSMGGDTLYIEATNVTTGKQEFKQTGQLGSVMVESSEIAYTYVRSFLDKDKKAQEFFNKNFIHLHVPAGATPKDGPSAGVTMAIALYSLAINKPVKKMVAMTGELSLTGRIMPIGGVKEKTIAAKRAKIVELIFPEENKKDFDELPAHIRKGLKPQFVSTFKQAVNLCF